MNLSLLDKIGIIFKYIFSSFLSIEMFIVSLLLFCILLFNLKKENKIIQIAAVGIYLGFLVGIIVSYSSYVKACLDAFFKMILNYIYFPSTVAYFFIILFVTVMMLITVFSNKISKFKKTINYAFFSVLYFLFMSFVALASYENYDLINVVNLYENETILSIVQISNFILVIWLLYTLFYKLFCFYKKKFD